LAPWCATAPTTQRLERNVPCMQTLALTLAAVLGQGALACECDLVATWVSPHGAVFAIAQVDTDGDEPAPFGASRETFITRVGQDDKGDWTMTKEAIHGMQIDDQAIGSAPSPGTGEIATPAGVR
jgi:hypothetical protein